MLVLVLGGVYGFAFGQGANAPVAPNMAVIPPVSANESVVETAPQKIENDIEKALAKAAAANNSKPNENVKVNTTAGNRPNLSVPPTPPKILIDDTPVLENKFFRENDSNAGLSKIERDSLRIAEQWQSNEKALVQPIAGQNGAVKFVYGAHQPSIICAVLQVCDIALQVGEQINSIHLGDTVRWTVEPAITGDGDNEIQHLIVKPLDVGLKTSLIVTTNRRTYHLGLRSHRSKYMPFVSFSYPEDSSLKFDMLNVRNQRQNAGREKEHLKSKKYAEKAYSTDLKFNYSMEGNAPWKPVRVFSDGVKTYIDMPTVMSQTEAPTLLVLRKEGGLFTDDETVIVNYRVQGGRYIVDSVFDRAILIAGVGRSQDRVLIRRLKENKNQILLNKSFTQ